MLMDAALNENPNANHQVFRPIIPLKVRPAGLFEGFATRSPVKCMTFTIFTGRPSSSLLVFNLSCLY
jgi:hypothetical protein